MTLILASSSPRRAALLAAAGFVFSIEPIRVDERLLPDEDPRAYVARLAEAKSAAIDAPVDSFVVGADTSVVTRGELLGKPEDEVEAAAMLGKLSGNTHEVLTGVAIRHGNRLMNDVAVTTVYFRTLTPEEIEWYVGSGEWRGKAGAYAIQGLASRFVERIEGSYSNVVGLPVATVYRLLKQLGFSDGDSQG